MFPFLLVFAVLSATGLVMLVQAARTAPEGYQDAKGFHALNPDDLAVTTLSVEEVLFLERQLALQPWY